MLSITDHRDAVFIYFGSRPLGRYIKPYQLSKLRGADNRRSLCSRDVLRNPVPTLNVDQKFILTAFFSPLDLPGSQLAN